MRLYEHGPWGGSLASGLNGALQTGKPRWTPHQIAYNFVGIPKDRRKIPTGEVEAACKKLIEECCTQHGFTLLALETEVVPTQRTS
ncbi:transposase [Acidiferrobacter thiooxydans]|uniref:Transposase IS200-like domain-containing protein n=1 Tax=Acidiferrobacter thiooxydans TaxID=163359 RepID=A0A368HIB0_9GAMM|nr:hypothetical protein C4900_14680 [Acidiferrobacter thiooxydans]